MTGDWYMADRQIEALDFLKIDVEGAEYQVLEGLKDCLSQARVHCLRSSIARSRSRQRNCLPTSTHYSPTSIGLRRYIPTMSNSGTTSGRWRFSSSRITAPSPGHGRTCARCFRDALRRDLATKTRPRGTSKYKDRQHYRVFVSACSCCRHELISGYSILENITMMAITAAITTRVTNLRFLLSTEFPFQC